MIVSLIILAALVIVGSVLYYFHRRDLANATPEEPEQAEAPAECCGMHAVCERDSLLAAASADIVYYDDEELDTYRGRDPKSYDIDEIEQFRDVLLTLQPDDVAPWARSIQLRGIELPTQVRDELLLIVGEARQSRNIKV